MVRGNDYQIIKALYCTPLEYVRHWVQTPRTTEESKQEKTILGLVSLEKHRPVTPFTFASQIICIDLTS